MGLATVKRLEYRAILNSLSGQIQKPMARRDSLNKYETEANQVNAVVSSARTALSKTIIEGVQMICTAYRLTPFVCEIGTKWVAYCQAVFQEGGQQQVMLTFIHLT